MVKLGVVIVFKNHQTKLMTENEMKKRTKAFALRVIKLASTLSKDFVGHN